VNAIHHDKIAWFTKDLHESVALVIEQQSRGLLGSYGTLE
jgi:hypothetical protein